MAASSSSRDRTTGGGSNGANNGGSAGGSGSNGGSGRRDSGNNNSSSSSTDGRASTPLGWLKAIFTGSGSGSGSGSGNNPTVGSQSASTPTTPALAQNPNSSSHNPSVSIQPNQSNLTSPAASATVVRSGSRLGIASLNSSRANTPSPAPWSGPFSLSLSRNSNNNANNTNNHHRSRDNSVDRDTLDDRDRAASPMPRNHNNGKKDSAGGTSTIQRSAAAARSASPVPSVSSTLAAERLVRLSDAQLAELAAQVTAEAYRRRTPIGALLATYERASASQQMRSNKPPTTAARIAIMTNEKFKIFAADLDVEATRRQIPGIDIVNSTKPATTTTPLVLGSAGSQPPSGHNSLNRSNTNGTLSSSATRAATVGATTDQHHSTSTTTPPPSPTRGSTPLTLLLDTSTAGAAGLQTLPTRLLPILASDATGPTSHSSVASSSAATVNGGGGGSTGSMSKPASVQSLKDPTSAGVVVVLMTAEDFTVARDRMATLGDEEVRVLVRDVRAELEVREEALALAGARQRRRLGGFSGGDEGEGGVDVFSIEEGDEAVGASEGADTRPAAAAGTGGSGNGRFGSLGRLGRGAVAGAAVGTGTGNRGEPSPMRGAPGVTQRRLIPAAPTGSTGAAGPAPSPIAVERQTLLKTITNVDLARLWEDILNEVEKRETAGVSILGDVVASPVAACLPAATALAAEGEAAVARGSVESSVESKSKRRVPRGGEDKDLGKEEAGKKEIGNAAVWRTRISKLSDDQLAEVLADVYDESTRRKEKQEPFLPPRENLSPKRNDARKELAKLPSKELKVLWTIIYENMTNRNML